MAVVCSGTSSKWASMCRTTRLPLPLRRHVGRRFRNGMLLSRSLKLVAAFDHRHIFIDPNPDPEVSLEGAQAPVRTATVELGRLYDRKKMSPVVAFYSRSEKSISLSWKSVERWALRRQVGRTGDSHQCHPEGARRPVVVRRHRHLHQSRRTRARRRSATPSNDGPSR